MGKSNKVHSRIAKNSWMRIILIVALFGISAAVPALCSSDSVQSPDAVSSATMIVAETTGLDGASLLDTRCSVCHSANKAKHVKKSPTQWEQTVNRMIGKGAKLTEDEKKVLLDYLSNTYGE